MQTNVIASIASWLSWDADLIFYAMFSLALDVSRVQLKIYEGLVNPDCIDALEKIAVRISPSCLQQWMITLLEKQRFLAQGMNLNTQLMLEDLLLRFGK